MIVLTHEERRIILFVSFLLALGFSLSLLAKARGASSCLLSLYSNSPQERFDINKAGRQDLIGLPGIGEKTADSILRRRQTEGDFTDLAELKKIKGMTDAKLDKLKEYLYISK